jgi:hypothetical protein
MKENDSFSEEDKSNINESINIPTFSIASTKKYKKRKIINKKNDKDDEYEELTCYKINNNNIEKINEPIIDQDLRMNLEDINKIMTFDKDKDKNLIIEDKKIQKSKIRFGRKKKNSSEIGKHNKYSGDNLIRKCKGIILHYLYVLINNIIAENYKYDFNYNEKTKKLLKINQSQIINSDVDFNKDFLNKTLKDIFSENVTLRCSRYDIAHNKNLINSLLSEEDKDKQNLFKKIFNLTFLDCLKHFRGTKTIKELNNLVKYDEICKRFEEDEDYLYSFKFYIENYEKIMENKKSRSKKGKKGKKINK